jgi:hypothetical protein
MSTRYHRFPTLNHAIIRGRGVKGVSVGLEVHVGRFGAGWYSVYRDLSVFRHVNHYRLGLIHRNSRAKAWFPQIPLRVKVFPRSSVC